MRGALLGKMAVAATLLALPGLLCSQAIEIAPKAVKLVHVEGGPLALAKVSIRFAGADPQNWTVTATPGGRQRSLDPVERPRRHNARRADGRHRRLARGIEETGQISGQHQY
jgi:hypothetical protein